MKTWAVLTTFQRVHWSSHARDMVRSFRRHWPVEVPLYAVVEDGPPPELAEAGVVVQDLARWAPLWPVFDRTYRGRPAADGRLPTPTGKGMVYDYRRDGLRFARKVFAITAAAQRLARFDRLIWLDADVITHQAVPRAWLDRVLLQPRPGGLVPYVSYLGRRAMGLVPETGFLAFNQRHPAHADFMKTWATLYASGSVFGLAWQEDAFTFDWLRQVREREGVLVGHDLGEGVRGGHVFVNAVTGEWGDHLKGPRKQQGHSHARDLTWPRQEPWWQAVRAGRRPSWEPAEAA